MAAEMRANIRLGLAAGECVRVERPAAARFSAVHRRAGHAGTRQRAGADGDGPDVGSGRRRRLRAIDEPMVQATANGIQRRAGDTAFGLMHSGASSVTYTVGAQGTLGARYTDPETGNVTMTKVYVE